MPKIHELPPLLDDPAIEDVLPMDDASVSDPSSPDKTKKITIEQIQDFILNQLAVGNNLLINGNMDVWQRNTTFTPLDDVFICDRWNALVEANSSWTFARDTDVPSTGGSKYSLKCSNATANNQSAIVQILEARDASQLAGQSVSLSFYAKTTGLEISNLRCAILSWSSTEDVVTSDVISAWAQNGTNPTWATNWTMENTPANLALTNSWQKFSIENVAIDTASMKNIAVVIWVDDGTIASGDDFWVTQVMLNTGGTAADFVPRPYSQELQLCQRYLYRLNPDPTNAYVRFATGANSSGTDANVPFVFPVELFRNPTLVTTGTPSQYGLMSNVGSVIACTSIALSANSISKTSATIAPTVAGGLAAGNATIFIANNSTAAYVQFEAEL